METREISFTQYVLPNGAQKTVKISRPAEIADLADAIMKRGYRFECELLTTSEVSLTITNKDGDADMEVVPNGAEVPVAIDRMIKRFAEAA